MGAVWYKSIRKKGGKVMSRRDGKATVDLGGMIDDYKSGKDEESKIKKKISALGDEIKRIMTSNKLDNFSSDKWTAKVTVTQKEDFNELKAIDILKDNLSKEDLSTVIKTKEYIDDDALEKLVYAGKFDISKLQSCRTPGAEVVTLRISKKK
jgi:hypothetical protein